MDTRFWGPSSWRLLHLMSFHSANIHRFFELLPWVLPCKYCRASLHDYYTADPVPTKDYAQWLYRIHNRVNGKLRDQKLLETKDPSWLEVKKTYTDMIAKPCIRQRMVGWDFLFSVAYTTPGPSVGSSPMPNAPPYDSLHSPELRNRWGVSSRKERLRHIREWWSLLPNALPFEEWRRIWTKSVPSVPSLEKGRRKITSWLYGAEKAMCRELRESTVHESFSGLCSELSTFASGCGKSRNLKTKTCRASKGKHTLKKRRSTKYKMTGGFL
jgi:hypothetical protein